MPTQQEQKVAKPQKTGGSQSSIRGVVQRILFASPSPQAPNELYSLGTYGAVRPERHRVVVEPDARLTTNTYFGRLPASYLQRWTRIRELEAVFRVRGSGRLEIHASDAEGEPRILSTAEVATPAEQEVRLKVTLDRFMDGGSIWVEAVTTAEELTIEDVRWVVGEPLRDRLTSVVICTFNRADDCLNTMRALGEDTELLATLEHVYVVDQGNDTVQSREGFDKVVELFQGKLRYLRQPNLGGAGGFTRGMFEISGVGGKHANVLLMDDDVLLEPETVLRMASFANNATDPVIVGGQMLYLYHPNRLHIGAETTDLALLKPGVPVAGAVHNVDLTKELPHRRVTAGYNAWWSCLIPAEVIERCGLPLPLFFQWDDIEYGTRAGRHGFATVTLPGAAVWHADFAWKDWDDWARYFSLRNSLITSALHWDGFDGKTAAKVLAKQLAEYLVSMQYGMAATLLKALEDFLTGPSVLTDGGVAAAADIRKLRNDYPDTHRKQPADLQVEGASTLPIIDDPGNPSLPKAVMVKRVLNILTGRNGGAAQIMARDAKWWHVSLFKSVIVTDSAQDAFRVRQFDREVVVDLAKRGTKMLARLAKEGVDAREAWRGAMGELTTRENWDRLFKS
ncbi:glycosyltransferase [Kibdelosporangium persicum]|uniref:Galactofuranosyl transferase n=1 Tax=Kibdelosporangium persicum TaxID=2698649 RepID=A0ABX2F4U8_9PSEU|nr:glycosyltransferase [Kibdelosporangium persicum]NRN66364.1 Galactofuranosyl transferase [Kibdelosporangium persicum]